MYEVTVSKFIWAGESIDAAKGHALCHRLITLPFAPFVGLSVYSELWDSKKIISVRWEMDFGKFNCKAEDEYPHATDGKEFSFEWLVTKAKSTGWFVTEVETYESDFEKREKVRGGLKGFSHATNHSDSFRFGGPGQ
jgi:hypothetical protein